MIVESFSVAPLGCNCTILGDEEAGKAIVVDPGGEAPRILQRLRELKLQCTAIVHTHTHFDHVGATAEVQEATNAPTIIHHDDLFLYEGVQMQLDTFGVPLKAPKVAEIDRFVKDGDSVDAGAIQAGIVHTPGHTPGSICIMVNDEQPIVLAGDTLFQNSIGRTDLWGGSMPDIISSIKTKLLSLPDDTIVITGHGPNTTIGHERKLNPFLR